MRALIRPAAVAAALLIAAATLPACSDDDDYRQTNADTGEVVTAADSSLNNVCKAWIAGSSDHTLEEQAEYIWHDVREDRDSYRWYNMDPSDREQVAGELRERFSGDWSFMRGGFDLTITEEFEAYVSIVTDLSLTISDLEAALERC